MTPLPPNYYKYLTLLKRGAFERHHRSGWRFGTRKISDSVVDRLVDAGRAEIRGERVHLIECEATP